MPGQPIVEAGVPCGNGQEHLRRVGQQNVAVAAAGVQQVHPAGAAGGKQLVDVMLHQQLQKEGAAAQRGQRPLCRHGKKELLNAGKIGGIKQTGFFIPEFRLQTAARGTGARQIACRAGGEGSCDLLVVVKGDVRRVMAGETSHSLLQQTQEPGNLGRCPRLRMLTQLPAQGLHPLLRG